MQGRLLQPGRRCAGPLLLRGAALQQEELEQGPAADLLCVLSLRQNPGLRRKLGPVSHLSFMGSLAGHDRDCDVHPQAIGIVILLCLVIEVGQPRSHCGAVWLCNPIGSQPIKMVQLAFMITIRCLLFPV